MKSEWINKRFNIRNIIQTNKIMIIMIIFNLLICIILLTISKITSSSDGFCNVFGKILLLLGTFMAIALVITFFVLTKNKVLTKLKKQNITQTDLNLLDEEMNNIAKKQIHISAANIIITENFLIKDYIMANKVEIYKISNLCKITYSYDSFNATPGRAVRKVNTGNIKFYDSNEQVIFSLYELKLDVKKLIDYFKENMENLVIEMNK